MCVIIKKEFQYAVCAIFCADIDFKEKTGMDVKEYIRQNWSKTVSHDITEDYDVVTTTSHHRHYYHCLKCHERWSKETSNITDVKKSIKSRRINTTTKRTEWEKRKKW